MAYPDRPFQKHVEPPQLPFSIYALSRSRFGIKVRVNHSLPQDVPQAFLDQYGERVANAAQRVPDNVWKVNTQIHKGPDGILNRLLDRTTLQISVRPSTYASWYETGRSTMNPVLRDTVRHAGTSVTLQTSDNLLMFQFRSDQNGSYRGWFGAGASGSVEVGKVLNNPDGVVDWARRGVRLGRLAATTFKNTALRELEEETGHSLGRTDRAGRRHLHLIGVFQTMQKPVDEFAFIAQVPQTSEEIVTTQNHAIDKHPDAKDPMDRIGFIEASSRAIEKLVTQVRSPLIPTALGTMLLTGRYLAYRESLAQQRGLFGKRKRANEDAEAWLERVSYDAAVHYEHMDRDAREVNIEFNKTVPEGKTKRLEGLDPWVRPEDQGARPMEEALQEKGLYYKRDGKTVGERQYTSPARRRFALAA